MLKDWIQAQPSRKFTLHDVTCHHSVKYKAVLLHKFLTTSISSIFPSTEDYHNNIIALSLNKPFVTISLLLQTERLSSNVFRQNSGTLHNQNNQTNRIWLTASRIYRDRWPLQNPVESSLRSTKGSWKSMTHLQLIMFLLWWHSANRLNQTLRIRRRNRPHPSLRLTRNQSPQLPLKTTLKILRRCL